MEEEQVYELLWQASMAFHRLEEQGYDLTKEEEKAWEKINDWLMEH